MKTKIGLPAIDLAFPTVPASGGKGSFRVCVVGANGAVLFNRAMSRTRLAASLAEEPACVVAMEACATSHHWGRVAQAHGHEVRLVPAAYVKPFPPGAGCSANVKRRKSDRADAVSARPRLRREAIAEAAMRPTMRFVAVKSAETRGRAVAFRTHRCPVRQRTQPINARRAEGTPAA